MAKYVGKIFKGNNKILKLRAGNGSHYIKVFWYNPNKKKFLCRAITSIEEKFYNKDDLKKYKNKNKISVKVDNVYYVIDSKTFLKMRNGKITPIPISNTKGFDVWSGFYETRYYDLTTLQKLKKQSNKYIKNKKHGL